MTDVTRLTDAILAAFTAEINNTNDPVGARERIAQKIAQAVITEITKAQINYVSGLQSGSGPVVGIFEGNLS